MQTFVGDGFRALPSSPFALKLCIGFVRMFTEDCLSENEINGS
jgi:hypothetical protein